MPRRNRRPPAPEPFGMTSIANPQTQARTQPQRHPRQRNTPGGESTPESDALPVGAADFGVYGSPGSRSARPRLACLRGVLAGEIPSLAV